MGKYHIKAVPSLVVISKDNNIVTRDGISELESDVFPWDRSGPVAVGVSSILETLEESIEELEESNTHAETNVISPLSQARKSLIPSAARKSLVPPAARQSLQNEQTLRRMTMLGFQGGDHLDEQEHELLALTLPLTEDSYDKVLRMESSHATRYFLKRVMVCKGMSVEDEDMSRMMAAVGLGLDMEATLREGAPNGVEGETAPIQDEDTTSMSESDSSDDSIDMNEGHEDKAKNNANVREDASEEVVGGADQHNADVRDDHSEKREGDADQQTQPAEEPGADGEKGMEKDECEEAQTAEEARIGGPKQTGETKSEVPQTSGESVECTGKKEEDQSEVSQKALPEDPLEDKAKAQGGTVAVEPSKGKGSGKSKGAGKGKGKGKAPPSKQSTGPSRTEKDNWVTKKKSAKVPKMRWKRRLENDSLVNMSESFAEEGEEPVKEDLLQKRFVMALSNERKTNYFTSKVQQKPLLWMENEMRTPDKMRQKMAIVATKMHRPMQVFISMLQRGAVSDILSSPQFSYDAFSTLEEAIGNICEEEWARLRRQDSPQVYSWDWHIEGFFQQFDDKAKSTVAVMMAHFELLERTKDLSDQLNDAYEGICATTASEELRRILRKILFIGNCFNAGDATTCRADGFDCVDLLKAQLCIDMPRGVDNVSVLEHIRLHELSDQDVAAMKKLAEILRPWRKPDDEKDQTDLMDVQNDKAMCEKLLRRSQQILEKIGGDADFLKPHWDSLNHIETRLEFLRGGSSCKGKGHGGILELQRYFFHNPPRDKSFAVGRILGYVAIFAKRCAGMM